MTQSLKTRENTKLSENASSSNGESPELGNTKNEETHQKITLLTFDKRDIQGGNYGGGGLHLHNMSR